MTAHSNDEPDENRSPSDDRENAARPSVPTPSSSRAASPGPDPDPHLSSARDPDASDIGVFFTRSGPLNGVEVTVAGGGAIGIWTAFMLHTNGAAVTVVDDGRLSTYLTAAGWIFPYHATDPRAIPMSIRADALWRTHAAWLPLGSVTEEYTEVQRATLADSFPEALKGLAGYEPMPKDELHPGLREGFRARSLVAPAQVWHPAMKRMLISSGVIWKSQHLETAEDVDTLEGDFVIDALGLGSAFAFGDSTFLPLRGTVAYLQGTPEFEGVYSWDTAARDHKDPYAINQAALGRIVVGGETTPMSLEKAKRWIDAGGPPDEAVAEELVHRIWEFVPQLRGLEVLGVSTAIRPARDRLLLGVDQDMGRILHASGFGGFGVTCAPEVGRLVVAELITILANRRRIHDWDNGC
jgi:glycine/D-amino acid oxidase-like deaminating enzyme